MVFFLSALALLQNLSEMQILGSPFISIEWEYLGLVPRNLLEQALHTFSAGSGLRSTVLGDPEISEVGKTALNGGQPSYYK